MILQALYHFIRSVSLWIRGFWQPRCCEGCVGRVERCGSGAQFIQDLSVSCRRCLVDFHIIFGILWICNVFLKIRCSKIGQKAWVWMCRGIGFGCSCIAHQYVYMYVYSYITMICKLLGTTWYLIRLQHSPTAGITSKKGSFWNEPPEFLRTHQLSYCVFSNMLLVSFSKIPNSLVLAVPVGNWTWCDWEDRTIFSIFSGLVMDLLHITLKEACQMI